MFAVLKTGGKQYTVRSGDVLRVEKLACEAGDTIQFNDVLMVGEQVGAPFVAGAAVQATVIDQIKGEKTIHFVRRRRKHSSKRTKGHRQQLTLVRVTDILEAGADSTGVKAAIGTGARAPAPTGLQAVASQAAAATEGVRAFAGDAVEQVEALAGAVAERTEALASTAAETVTEAVEDATSSTAGKVALAAVAVAGVAAIAAAVLAGTSATADDAQEGAAGDADSKE